MKPVALLFVFGVMLAMTVSSVLFKYAADSSGKRAVWYFIIGNIVGALGPVAITLGLRGGNANVIFALSYGGGFALVQVASWRIFHQPLSIIQWTGIGLIALGAFLVQIRPAS